MKGVLRKIKLNQLLFLVSALLIVLSTSVYGAVLSASAYQVIAGKIMAVEKSNLKQIDVKITDEIKELEGYLYSLNENSSLQKDLARLPMLSADSYEKNQLSQNISSILKFNSSLHEGIYSTYLLLPGMAFSDLFSQTEPYPLNYEMVSKPEFVSRIQTSYNGIALYPDIETSIAGKPVKLPGFTFTGQIQSANDPPVYSIIQMNANWFDNLFSGTKSDLLILDKSTGAIIWSNSDLPLDSFSDLILDVQANESFNYQLDGSRFYISSIKASYRNWHIVSIQSSLALFSSAQRIQQFSILMAVVSLILSFFLSSYFSKRITAPLNDLTKLAGRLSSESDRITASIRKLRRSLGETVLLYLLIVVMLPLIIYHGFLSLIADQILDRTMRDLLANTVDQTVSSIDTIVARNNRSAMNVMLDTEIQDYLKNNKLLPDSPISFNPVFTRGSGQMNTIKNVYVYDAAGNLVFYTGYEYERLSGDILKKKLDATFGEAILIGYNGKATNERYYKLLRKVRSIYIAQTARLDLLGYVDITFDMPVIESLGSELGINGSSFFLLDQENLAISQISEADEIFLADIQKNPATTFFSLRTINGRDYYTYWKKCTNAPWSFFACIPTGYILKDGDLITSLGFNVLFGVCIFTLLVAAFLSRMLSRGISRMLEGLYPDNSSYRHPTVNGLGFISDMNEIESLFNDMLLRIQKDMEAEKELSRAELKALQSQITPHFMSNTFESLNWMNQLGEKDNVSTMLSSLSELFRLGINEKKSFIPVEEEVRYAKAYLSIQSMRYASILHTVWDIDPATLRFIMPKLVLQPLIENSIYHGIRPSGKKDGLITIRTAIAADKLSIQVTDNGVGISAERMSLIRAALANGDEESLSAQDGSSGLGLFNVYRRLSIFYGSAFAMQLESEQGKGATITLTLPIQS